jgi:hypothetical protein
MRLSARVSGKRVRCPTQPFVLPGIFRPPYAVTLIPNSRITGRTVSIVNPGRFSPGKKWRIPAPLVGVKVDWAKTGGFAYF